MSRSAAGARRVFSPSLPAMPTPASSPMPTPGLRKNRQNDEVLRFVEAWRVRTGALPAELVFDSRLTTYANLARLDAMGIAFLTLRRRTARMVAALLAEPPEAWRRITLTNVGRIYRKPRILERRLRIRDYPGEVRQIAITDLGHEKPTLLLSNQMDEPASRLVDRYARRMVIENTIADAIDFFHMDALSAAVPMRIDLDVQLTLMASSLYRLLGIRVGQGFEVAKARTIFRKLVNASAAIRITEDEIIVTPGAARQQPAPACRRLRGDRRADPVARKPDPQDTLLLKASVHIIQVSWECVGLVRVPSLTNPTHSKSCMKNPFGAGDETRTHDPNHGKVVLYH